MTEEQIVVSKQLLNNLSKMLNQFDYTQEDEDVSTSEFVGRVNQDWFYHLKNELEKLI